MQAHEALTGRRSIRTFSPKPVDSALIEKIIDAGRFAPTARNVQPWEFVAVTDQKTRDKLASLAENGRFISQAPCCIAVFCQDTKYYLEDGCAATVNILTASYAQGLGSCWVAGDKKPYCSQVASLLKVPQGYKLVSLIAMGYTPEQTGFGAPDKRSLQEMLHWEKF